jgi:hypothetical protein
MNLGPIPQFALKKIPSGSGGGYDRGMETETRLALLEQIAKDTKDALNGIRAEVRESSSRMEDRLDRDFRDIRETHDRDFRITFSAIVASFLILGGLLSYGYFRLDDRYSTLASGLYQRPYEITL